MRGPMTGLPRIVITLVNQSGSVSATKASDSIFKCKLGDIVTEAELVSESLMIYTSPTIGMAPSESYKSRLTEFTKPVYILSNGVDFDTYAGDFVYTTDVLYNLM